MKKTFVVTTFLSTVLLVSLLSVPVVYTALNASTIRVVVGFERTSDFDFAKRYAMSYGKIVSEIPEIRALVLEVPLAAVTIIANIPFVRYIEEDAMFQVQSEVRWNIEMVNATDVWYEYSPVYGDAAYGYHPVVQVAVIDTGIDTKHRDLRGSVTYCIVSLNQGATYYEGTNIGNCRDPNGHGTHVAGIIAARLNRWGIAGVAPKVVLYAVRALDQNGRGYASDIAKGIVEAVKGPDDIVGTADDADILSMSLGGRHSEVLYDAVRFAYENGAIQVAAAGNNGGSSPLYPAAYSEVIAVGAIDQNYVVPWWSNRNPDVVAPGVNVTSTWLRGSFETLSGTSMACPHVSGALALALALRLTTGLPKLTPDEAINLVRATAIDIGEPGYDEASGYGLLDAYALVKAALSG